MNIGMMLDTIADIHLKEWHLEVRCLYCGRSMLFPPALIPRRIPADLPANLAAAFFRCSGCKGKQLESRMYDVNTAPGRGGP